MFDLLSIAVAAVVAVAVLAVVIWRARRRDRRWPEIAAALGFDYARLDDAPLAPFDGFRAIAAGSSRSLANVLAGNRSGVDVWLADFRYRTEPVGSVEPYGFTLCLLESAGLDLPDFFLVSRDRPRSSSLAPVYVKAGDDLSEVRIPGELPFADRFRLYCTSPEAALRFLTPSLYETLVAIAAPYVELEGRGPRVVVDTRSWVAPEHAAARIDGALAVVDELRRAQPR